ncbi:MAG: TetR/AcrR family transcriptional regulator [Acidobacteria bacterium]|nr:TetR/AcrR family transcriptional regulator [Acidobacteriota bacterium]MBS1866352.1 TetR/AcrR family transcriptional regulator [Acidobacteriota bacterium]
MGHSRADKAVTHERIVRLASKRFREKGLDGIGIAELLKEAGLTVGGFYKHFASRDELVTEAVGSALGRWKRKTATAAEAGKRATYQSLVEDYLSERHRDRPGTGCPVSALAGEIGRSDKRTRALVTEEVKDNIALLARLIGERNDALSPAILAYCALVGALGLARAVTDEKLSRELLKTVATQLKKLPGRVS